MSSQHEMATPTSASVSGVEAGGVGATSSSSSRTMTTNNTAPSHSAAHAGALSHWTHSQMMAGAPGQDAVQSQQQWTAGAPSSSAVTVELAGPTQPPPQQPPALQQPPLLQQQQQQQQQQHAPATSHQQGSRCANRQGRGAGAGRGGAGSPRSGGASSSNASSAGGTMHAYGQAPPGVPLVPLPYAMGMWPGGLPYWKGGLLVSPAAYAVPLLGMAAPAMPAPMLWPSPHMMLPGMPYPAAHDVAGAAMWGALGAGAGVGVAGMGAAQPHGRRGGAQHRGVRGAAGVGAGASAALKVAQGALPGGKAAAHQQQQVLHPQSGAQLQPQPQQRCQEQPQAGQQQQAAQVPGGHLPSGQAGGQAEVVAAGAPGGGAALVVAGAACASQDDGAGWASLVDGVLVQVVQRLAGHSSITALRRTCKHWRMVADGSIEQLSPGALRPKELIALFPRLQVLELIHCPNVRNRDLYVLAQSRVASQLRSLTIGDDQNKPWVTNRGLSSIGRISSLQLLALHDCNSITNNGLTSLAGLSHLGSLSLRGCKKITNNGLEVLQANSTLTSLNLHGCKRISDKGLAALAKLPLRALSLGHTRVKDEGMAYLAKLTHLTELHCTDEELTDVGLAHLSALTGLRALALRNCCEVGGEALAGLLPALPALTRLDLYKGWEFNDEQLLRCCVHLLGLRTLDLRGTWVTDKGLRELTLLSSLRELSLAPHLDLFSDSLVVVSVLTQLTALTLNSTLYSSALLAAIASLTGLRKLSLSSDMLGEDLAAKDPMPSHVLDAIARMTHLRTLDLSRRSVSAAQLCALAAALPALEHLVLHGCPLDGGQVSALERSHPHVTIHKRSALQLQAGYMAEVMAGIGALGLA